MEFPQFESLLELCFPDIFVVPLAPPPKYLDVPLDFATSAFIQILSNPLHLPVILLP